MADQETKSHGTQPPPLLDRGHPLPRRATPEKSVTLRHHRLARDASTKLDRLEVSTSNILKSPRRDSSGESHKTGQSDPKTWFDQSNRKPNVTFDQSAMDVDPPFFQKETDSSEEAKDVDARMQGPGCAFRQMSRQARPRLATAHSSSADDFRSVIDDLTIENKRLKEELKRYKQFGPDMMKKEKLFEIKVHGLPKRKKRELEATLRSFAASLEGSSEATSQRRKAGRHGKSPSSQETMSKHASSSSSHSRPVDSAYASMSTGVSSAGPTSSLTSQPRPSLGSRAKSSGNSKLDSHIQDTPDGLFPRPLELSGKEKKKFVVRRLEQLFTGRIRGRNLERSQSMSTMDPPSAGDISIPPQSAEFAREAQIQPSEFLQKKPRSRETLSSNSNGNHTDSTGHGGGSGDGNGNGTRSGPGKTSPEKTPLEQRPTRPRDLDPDRAQVPSENMDYIRHLGLVPQEFLPSKKTHYQDVSPDADGWVYLNLLCNLAQLHMISVTPGFIRSAVTEKSTKFQLSPDGRKIRWRGGTDGTKFSSDSSVDNSQKSPSTDDTDGSNEVGQRKKQKTSGMGDVGTPTMLSKETKFGLQGYGSTDSFHYKPLFVQQSSSMETSLEEGGSQSSSPMEDSNLDNLGDFVGSGSKKRSRDGAITYYSGAPFCADLSRDPGDLSPTTYVTSTEQRPSVPQETPVLRRSPSGSSLLIRPLSNDPAVVAEAMNVGFDQTPELIVDDQDSLTDEDVDFPWSDDPEFVQLRSPDPPLEPCGLGGVLPEDHFAVSVVTRRPVFSQRQKGRQILQSTPTVSPDTIAGRIAMMSTSSPSSQPPVGPLGGVREEPVVRIEYLHGRTTKLNPVALPPPAMFYPPFSSESEGGSDDDMTDSDEQDESVTSISKELMSQRANRHLSDNTYPDDQDLSSNDEEDEVDADNEAGALDESGEISSEPRDTVLAARTSRPGSSVATAGDDTSDLEGSDDDEPC